MKLTEIRLGVTPGTETPFSASGVFAQFGMEPPLNTLFRQLRDQWKAQEPGRNWSSLARLIGVPSQNVSQWASGSDGRKPPWHIIMYLAEATGYRVVGSSTEWKIEKIDA